MSYQKFRRIAKLQYNFSRSYSSVTLLSNTPEVTKAITIQVQMDQVYTLMYVIYKLNNESKLTAKAWVHIPHSDKSKTAVGQPQALVILGDTCIAVHFIFILNITDFVQQFEPEHIMI